MINLNNADKKNKSFMYQNLQKSKCYNSDFSNSNFDYVSFRGAHMKSCKFNECTFKGTEFIGTNLKESMFKNASFENTVFEGAKLEGVDFKGAKFKKTIFVNTGLEGVLNLNMEDPNLEIYSDMPDFVMDERLRAEIEKLMSNAYVKKSRVLDTKDKKMNMISVKVLLDYFGEEKLLSSLSKVDAQLDRDFYTLSYIIKMIEKMNA